MTKQTTAAQANAILDREEKAMSRIVAFALVDTESGESLGKITGSPQAIARECYPRAECPKNWRVTNCPPIMSDTFKAP